VAALVVLFTAHAFAADVQPFGPGSIEKIRQARAGKPFILSFWSVDCAHCPKELKALGELKRRHPRLDVVLVSTDSPAEIPALTATAERHGLGGVEQWVFADARPEKLRYEVDRRWWGELPRTYFSDGQGVEAVSGVVPEERLARWADRAAAASGATR
jgi:thiol-disulfide isomerase/thioredoxin